MISRLVYFYRPAFSRTVVYMLQSTEYQTGAYLKWLWRTKDFRRVAYRRQLDMTRPARLLLAGQRIGLIAEYSAGVALALWSNNHSRPGYWLAALLAVVLAPLVWAHLITLPMQIGRWLIIRPLHHRQIKKSARLFAQHSATKIAVAGSYGKTSMKEMLNTVLSEGLKVAATEANKNVPISHARFAQKLTGDEQVLVIEYGEGAPGDVSRFARVTQPDIGIITGLAPAHLDKYKSLQRAGEDIFSLADYLNGKNVYVNGESEAAKTFIKKQYATYSEHGVGKFKIGDVKVSIDGVCFTITHGQDSLNIKAPVLGRHQVGPLAAVCAIALQLGMTKATIEKGVAKVKPFEHRMQPYQLAGAWVIDDTYNGNIDGMKAGLALLAELPAKRKIYVTPGLVDQGPENKRVHIELGKAIAAAQPDLVVLMKNSATKFIKEGLGDFSGNLQVEEDPLNFYTNLDQIIAAGDLVLLQNDWTDNYS